MLRVVNLELVNKKLINLELPMGKILEIKGENGAGKSLFLKSLARLIPSSFEFLALNGKNSLDFSPSKWRSQVMYLGAEVFFNSEMSVQDFFHYPYQFHLHHSAKPLFLPEDFLPHTYQKVGLLSSGQKQLLSLLRSLSLNPQILLLDETFSHLDEKMRAKSIEFIHRWLSPKKALIYVSHQKIRIDNQDFTYLDYQIPHLKN